VQVSGVDSLFITKLDVLDDLAEIQVATEYESGGGRSDRFPAHADALERVTPVYRALPGWQAKLGAIERLQDLPKPVRAYLDFIAEFTGARIGHLSVGSERQQTIAVGD
jgi:adenylosuccinate synthase